jgi:nitrous oxidase accessory protein NosD
MSHLGAVAHANVASDACVIDPRPSSASIPHAPISITYSTDFDAAHGVTGGTGVSWNPYVISGWEINGTGSDSCISITFDSIAELLWEPIYVKIMGCNLYDADVAGIFLGPQMRTYLHADIEGNQICNIGAGNGVQMNSGVCNVVGNTILDCGDGISIADHSYAEVGHIDGNVIQSCDVGINTGWSVEISTMDYNDVSYCGNGVQLEVLSELNSFSNNTIVFNYGPGVDALEDSLDLGASVNNNNISNNGGLGMSLSECGGLTIVGNNFQGNGGTGLYVFGYMHGGYKILDNEIADNMDGLRLWDVHDSFVSKNRISGNDDKGVEIVGYLHPNFSTRNKITENEVVNNTYGFYLLHDVDYWNVMKYNTLFNNRLAGNAIQVFDNSNDTMNRWNTTYPTGGNFWSDYAGVDYFSGANQDEPGPDGIGDAPYVIDADSRDNYPLMTPPTMMSFPLPVVLGWNFISLPLVPCECSLPSALLDIDGDTLWDRVQWYDPDDCLDHWKQYNIKWATSLNDLPRIDHWKGLWVNVTVMGDGVIEVWGRVPQCTTIRLATGWNMVSYPSFDMTTTVSVAFWGTGAIAVETFDSDAQYRIQPVGPTYAMKPGYGYWVRCATDAVWTIDW